MRKVVPLLLLLAASGQAFAAPKALPFPTEVHRLPNGLQVVMVKYPSPGLAAYYTLMRVGSRNEVEEGRSGYAHFFEHMMFAGTQAHPASDYEGRITKLGLDTNAFTNWDQTVYHLYGPASALPQVIELEADRFQHLQYTPEAFKTEAGAIRGEYDKSASDPDEKLSEVMQDTAYTRHTYKHTVIGFERDILAMPGGFDYSREFFRRYYTPDDATIIVVGDFDAAQTLALIEKAYGGWSGKADPALIPTEPPQTRSRRAKIDWPSETLPRLWISWHVPGASDLKATAALRVLNNYLFGSASALYRDLVNQRQLVEVMAPTWDELRDPGLFGVLLQVKDPRNLAKVEKAVLHAIGKLTKGADPKLFEDARANLRSDLALSLDKPDTVALMLAITMSPTGEVDRLNREWAALDALTPKDLSVLAQRHFLDRNRTTVTLTSKAKAEASR